MMDLSIGKFNYFIFYTTRFEVKSLVDPESRFLAKYIENEFSALSLPSLLFTTHTRVHSRMYIHTRVPSVNSIHSAYSLGGSDEARFRGSFS